MLLTNLGALSFASILAFATSNPLESRHFAKPHIIDESSEQLTNDYAGDSGNANHTVHELVKRIFNIPTTGQSASTVTQLGVGYWDMINLLQVVIANPHLPTMNWYFDGAAADITAVFQTVLDMSQPGGTQAQDPALRQYGPTALDQITVKRVHGGQPLNPGTGAVLADSDNVSINDMSTGAIPTTQVYDWGWQVLYRRFRYEIDCSMIGPKVNYKMQFLGGVLLHEILYVFTPHR